MGVKHEIRNPKYETIWIHTLLRKESLGLTGVWKFKILNFQNRSFGWGGPKLELLLKQPSIIGAICVFDAKKGLDPRFPILVTRYQQGSYFFLENWIFAYSYQRF